MEGPEATRPAATSEEDRPPPRPRTDSELKFKMQKSVRWFAPDVLADSALRVLISSGFGAFLDKRELQASVRPATPGAPSPPGAPAHDQPRDWTEAGPVWVDFIADTGDGFPATYTVAWLAAQSQLKLSNYAAALPRGQIVVLGGDEVYPVGDADAYENRFTRPYEASLPWLTPPHNPELYAIPGNHDWYDGLTSFFRVFCQNKWIGCRRTFQTRSYFAIPLPHRWWIWGIDIQLDSYIDQPQQDYFKALDLRAGDKVILCTGIPSWYEGRDSRTYKNLAFVERTLIDRRGASLVLCISGDSHHYTRYVGEEDGAHKVTAGGGGAFTHPTHTLGRHDLVLPVGAGDRAQRFRQAAAYPSYATSRALTLGALALPFRNASFTVVPAVLYLLLGWASQFSLEAFAQVGDAARPDFDDAAVRYGWEQVLLGLFKNPVSVLIIVIFWGGLIGFAKPSTRLSEKAQSLLKWPLGTVHVALHVLAVILVGLASVQLVAVFFDGGLWFTVFLLLFMGVLGGLVGGLVMGLYLAASCALMGAHGNEAFSAMRLTRFKNFLRLHFDGEGELTVYAIGVDRCPPRSRWRLDPDKAHEAPWIAPHPAPPAAHLIEKFTVNARTTRP